MLDTGEWKREHLSRPLRLADLTDDLLWPKLLRAAPLALRPARVLVAFFTLLLLALLWRSPALFTVFGGDVFLADLSAVFRFSTDSLGRGVQSGSVFETLASAPAGFFRGPLELVAKHPAWTIVLVVLSVPVVSIGGGTISRMVACEFSQAFMLAWTDALGMALRRRNSLIGAAVAPLLIVGVLLGVLSIGGWALLNWTGLNLLGAAVYPIFLAGGFAAGITLIGYVFGQCLLAPAVVCENTDAIDAMQRAYAYVIASPLRLGVYAAILALQFLAVVGVLGLIVGVSLHMTAWASTALSGPEAAAMVGGVFRGIRPAGGDVEHGASMISFWVAIPTALLTAFMLSFYFSASTILYILLRRLNDGQDPVEIWTPAGARNTGGREAGAGGEFRESVRAPVATPTPERSTPHDPGSGGGSLGTGGQPRWRDRGGWCGVDEPRRAGRWWE